MEGLGRLRRVLAAGTGVAAAGELDAVARLPVLEDLDLSGTPLSRPADTLRAASCFRLVAIHRLEVRLGMATRM